MLEGLSAVENLLSTRSSLLLSTGLLSMLEGLSAVENLQSSKLPLLLSTALPSLIGYDYLKMNSCNCNTQLLR